MGPIPYGHGVLPAYRPTPPVPHLLPDHPGHGGAQRGHRGGGAALRLRSRLPRLADLLAAPPHPAPPLHPVIEFANRLVVFLLVVSCVVTVLGRLLRTGRCVGTSAGCPVGLILGVLGEAVIGAFVVYSKLNAYVVVVHFMVGMALLAVAVVLTLEAGHRAGPGTPAVTRRALWLSAAAGRAHRRGAGRRGRHHRGRPARRRQGGEAHPHRVGGHDPHPCGDRPDQCGGPAGPALGAVEGRRSGPRPTLEPCAPRRHDRPGHHRLHPILHPSPGLAGGHPRVRRGHGVVDRPLVPPRAVRPSARSGGRHRLRSRWVGGIGRRPRTRVHDHRSAATGDRPLQAPV